MVDPEKIVSDILMDNWDVTQAPRPAPYYDDAIKTHDYRQAPAIKVYIITSPEKSLGLGYTSRKYDAVISIDMRASTREAIMKIREHAKNLLLAKRKDLATISPYEVMVLGTERKVAAYSGFFHYVREVTLKKYAEAI